MMRLLQKGRTAVRIPDWLRRPLLRWAERKLEREPDEIITRSGAAPYLVRYHVVKTRWLTIYVHKFEDPDADPEPHDHPWDFVSIILSGWYDEDVYRIRGLGVHVRRVRRERGGIVFRHAEWIHRIAVVGRSGLHGCPVTLVICGPRRRRWGFWLGAEDRAPSVGEPPRWIEHKDFEAMR